MGIRSFLSRPLAAWVYQAQQKWSLQPEKTQEAVFHSLIRQGAKTLFGQDYGFRYVRNHEDFKKWVVLKDYEDLRPYIQMVKEGKENVLWPGKPLYFAKTSGTTSGTKYIPISRESIPFHINSARDALLTYIHQTGNSHFLDKKLIFLSGSPEMTQTAGIHTGRLSGIVNHHVPAYLRSNQMPTYATNCIDDWEEKLEKIIEETLHQPMSLISGIPPWVQMYFDRIQARTGQLIKDVFPDFSLFVYGGVNFEPYRKKLFDSIGRQVDSIETYPASEGFIAYQDSQEAEGLLLLLNHGIFYEFVPVEEFFEENPTRLSIGEIELGKNYALILNTNAGLWSYAIGDTVKFVSRNPYRLVVTGRIKHFISAFGEHVIGEEVENAMRLTLQKHPQALITEFSVAPMVTPETGLPYHEWLVAFEKLPGQIGAFAQDLDTELRKLNTYYDDLITGKILQPLKISLLEKDGFQHYMKSIGKLGGQNKVPRLSNDRKIADEVHRLGLVLLQR